MNKRHKMNLSGKAATSPQTTKRNAYIAAGIVLVVAAVTFIGLWWWKTNHAQISQPTVTPIQAEAASLPASAAAAKPNFEKLKGKWLRPDGGYVLEIKQVADDGKIDAAYLNPKPINIAKAAASSEAGKINVFVELRDRLYPGNFYTLVYDEGNDQLAGVYHHLGIQQQFEVIFVRIK